MNLFLSRHIFASILASIILFGNSAHADSYGVQVGAYKHLTQAIIDEFQNYGKVIQDSGSSLTKLIVTKTGSLQDTELLLQSLHDNGYKDAFIRKIAEHPHATAHSGHGHHHVESDPKWQKLTPEERRKTVYLDGVLHIKEGDQFILIR